MRYAFWIGTLLTLWAQDTLLIDARRRLRAYELARKREGWVVVGYPTAGYDPLRGIGAALVASIAYNGQKNEALFPYTPYKHYFFLQAGGYERESWYWRFFYDAPWIKAHPYRIACRLSYRNESQGQFWGVGEQAFLSRLPEKTISLYEKRLREVQLGSNGIWETRLAHHFFFITQWQGWLVGEHIRRGGLLRLMGGIRWTGEKLSSLQGRRYTLPTPSGEKVSAVQLPTLIDSAAQGLIPLPASTQVVLGRWQHRFFAGGAFIWDTRDFEVNPNKGLLAEVSHESNLPLLSFHKTSISLRTYHIWYESRSQRVQVTGALHLLATLSYGRVLPLTELQIYTRWADGRIPNLLSGPSTLRAFRENRLLAPCLYLLQYELRSRVAELRLLHQHFTGGPVIFVDIGAGRNTLALPSPQKAAIGIGTGARILWNMTTVLRADFAYGREGWQINFTTTHPF
ncbi:MAG: DUF5982 domain-containing protein [Bacteroidia bacterium]|nr:DUF5982 domain-containing protein [Bacteroidia bacterium]MDW8015446.1 DUF5982 domain-containing protein [Bacteroidia bacterium]